MVLLDAHELAYHVPQVYRSIHGRSCRRCRALPRRLPRWPAGLQQPLHLAARARHRRQRRWRVLQCVVCPWSALGGVPVAQVLLRVAYMTLFIFVCHGSSHLTARWALGVTSTESLVGETSIKGLVALLARLRKMWPLARSRANKEKAKDA